jgi:hypothetical protein
MRLAEVRNSENGYLCTTQNPYHNAICVVKEEASKFAPHSDNMKFNTHDKEQISTCIILTVYFLYVIRNIKYKLLIIIRKKIEENEIHYVGWGGSQLFAHLYKIN